MATHFVLRKLTSLILCCSLTMPYASAAANTASIDEEIQYLLARDGAANAEIMLKGTSSAEAAQAVREFLTKLDEFRDVLSKNVREPSQSELDQLRAAFNEVIPHREKLKAVSQSIYDGVVIDKQLARKIEESCARDDVSGRDVFKIFLKEKLDADEVQDAALGIYSLSAECTEVVKIAMVRFDEEIRIVEMELASGERNLRFLEDKLAKETDPTKKQELQESIDRETAKIKEKKDQRQELEKKKAKLDVLRLSLGIGAMLAAGVMMVFSGGSCSAMCAKIFALGVSSTATAIADSKRETTEITNIPGEPARYEDLADPARKPTESDVGVFKAKTTDLSLVPTLDEKGNYRIGADAGGNLLVMQVVPVKEIVRIDLASSTLTGLGGVTSDNLAKAKWKLVKKLEVSPTRVFLVVDAEVDGGAMQIGFSQDNVADISFVVTLQPD